MHPSPEDVDAANRLVIPSELEEWLTELLDADDGMVKCYGTSVSNPSQQLKNKFSQATGASGGLLSLTVRNKRTHDRAVRSAKEHWHDRTWSRQVASAIFNFYDDVEQRWRVGTIVADPGSHMVRLVQERLDDGLTVELVAPQEEEREQTADVEAVVDIARVAREFATAVRDVGLDFGSRHERLTRAFVCSLATKRFVVLTGLSGSGKTQLALQFGRWLGDDQLLLVPVRPDWTGPEYLFGYEDALRTPADDGRRPWVVPSTLEFVIRAAHDPNRPYLLLLDEMNLAHIERYFADALSGIESRTPVVPNLEAVDDDWYCAEGAAAALPFPENLFIVGTVNVDETTFAMSPKVLDRANTIEFRVGTDALPSDASGVARPGVVEPGPGELARGFAVLARDDDYHRDHPPPFAEEFVAAVRRLHAALASQGVEFGHRTFFEGVRLSALLAIAGGDHHEALDLFVLQKILPRLHGSRRALEPVLRVVGAFANDVVAELDAPVYDPAAPIDAPDLPGAARKVRRMIRALHANQFASFWD
ncbi:MAG: hypothetical protein RMA76_16270 [Deltaproteobacteria bacterium]|jgi:5-methylcytosine-specific restriction protein B